MGFGWLLIGYFIASVMSINVFGSFFRVVGFSVAAVGAKKLSAYHKSFMLLLASSALAIVLSALSASATLSDILYKNLIISAPFISESLSALFVYLRAAGELLFTVLMCVSVAMISKETGAPKLVYVSVRNLVIYAVYFIVQVVCWLPTEYVGEFLQNTALPVWSLILSVATALLNSLMLFSCYSKICDESDVDMPQKPSRFAFVNRMRAEREERAAEKAAERAAKEAAKRARFNKNNDPQPLDRSLYSEEQQRRSAENARKKKKNR